MSRWLSSTGLMAAALFLAGWSVAPPSFLQAQYVVRPGVHIGGPYGGGYGGYGGWGVPYGGTTAAGSAMTGMSEMIRASGEARLNNSAAAINAEDARSKYLDNQMKWQANYYQRRENYQAYAAEQQAKKAASRDRWLANRGSGAPEPLTPSQLDPVSGNVDWPAVLMGNQYSELRKQIEEVLSVRAMGSEGETPGALSELSKEMLGLLKRQIRDLPTQEYLAARSFLVSLGHEGYRPVR